MVDGKADEWQILKIDSSGVKLEPAGDIVGMKNYAACDKLRQRYGDKIAIIIIGLTGEMRMANSTVAVTDPEDRPARHAGRGGVGAMMGAKGLKAIVVDSNGTSARKAVDGDAFKAAAKKAADAIQNGPLTEIMHTLGELRFDAMNLEFPHFRDGNILVPDGAHLLYEFGGNAVNL